MHIPLSLLTALLPLVLAAPTPDPFAYAFAIPPPPPTSQQWKSAAALKSNSGPIANANAAPGGAADALRDAAIFSAGPQVASDRIVSRSSGYVKVRRRSTGMHAHKKKKRACAAKDANAPAQMPVYAAHPTASPSAVEVSAAESSTSASATWEAESYPASSASAITTATDAETPAPSESPSGGSSGSGSVLFPVDVKQRWTTAQSESGAISFDEAFEPLTAGRLPPSTPAPDGTYGLQSSFPAGTFKITPSSGFNFYSAGPSSVPLESATEVTLSYSVFFSDGFDFVKGGKLPGLYGGASADEAKSCSGGRQEDRGRCFSARLMWRKDGMGEFYNYFPTDVTQGGGYCEVGPMSHCDAKFGDSIGRGSFTFPSGKWTTVTQRLKLNTPASASNGEQELWVDGKQIMNLSNLRIRTTDETRVYGVMAQTFFGGGDASWASTRDQDAWFKDWSLGVVA